MTKRECRLCGYPSTEYRIIAVPLSSPAQDNAVCEDCVGELTAVVVTERDEARKRARSYRRVLLDNYGDMATQAMFAEDDCYFHWLREEDNAPEDET